MCGQLDFPCWINDMKLESPGDKSRMEKASVGVS